MIEVCPPALTFESHSKKKTNPITSQKLMIHGLASVTVTMADTTTITNENNNDKGDQTDKNEEQQQQQQQQQKNGGGARREFTMIPPRFVPTPFPYHHVVTVKIQKLTDLGWGIGVLTKQEDIDTVKDHRERIQNEPKKKDTKKKKQTDIISTLCSCRCAHSSAVSAF